MDSNEQGDSNAIVEQLSKLRKNIKPYWYEPVIGAITAQIIPVLFFRESNLEYMGVYLSVSGIFGAIVAIFGCLLFRIGLLIRIRYPDFTNPTIFDSMDPTNPWIFVIVAGLWGGISPFLLFVIYAWLLNKTGY